MPLNVKFHWNRQDLSKYKINDLDALITINGGEEVNSNLSIAIQLTIPENKRFTAIDQVALVDAFQSFIKWLKSKGVTNINAADYSDSSNRLRLKISGGKDRLNTLKALFNEKDFVIYDQVNFPKLESSYLSRFGSKPYDHGDGKGLKHDVQQVEMLKKQIQHVYYDEFLKTLKQELDHYENIVKSRAGQRQHNDRKLIMQAIKEKCETLNRTNMSEDTKLENLACFLKGCINKTQSSHTSGFFGFIGRIFTNSNLNDSLNKALTTLKTQMDVGKLVANEKEVEQALKKSDTSSPKKEQNHRYFY